MNVIITGGTKGIGRAMLEKFAGEGHNVITCSRSLEDLDDLLASFKIRYPSVTAKAKVTDLQDAGQVKAFAEWVLAEGIFPDVLVNNAGFYLPGAIHLEAEEVLQKMMQVNLYSCYDLIRLLLPVMIEKRKGHIFNICSVASIDGLANVGSYGISKFALMGLTRHLRQEMKPYGIKVTAVSPGSTFSASWEGADVDPQKMIAADDVAKLVYASSQLSAGAVVGDIIMRPQSNM